MKAYSVYNTLTYLKLSKKVLNLDEVVQLRKELDSHGSVRGGEEFDNTRYDGCLVLVFSEEFTQLEERR